MSVATFDQVVQIIVLLGFLSAVITVGWIAARRLQAHRRLDSQQYLDLAQLATSQADLIGDIIAEMTRHEPSYATFPSELWQRLVNLHDQAQPLTRRRLYK